MSTKEELKSENARLKAEVERLTKLCQATSPDGFIHIRDINAAKEGKPSDDDEDNRNRGGFNPRK